MLTEFLHDWVKSEPHICGYGVGTFRNTFFIQLSWGDWISISTSDPDPFLLDRGSLAKLIYFFQMRLDSFGYGWVIQRLPNSYTVQVSVNPDPSKTSRCFGSRQESLIEALLEVYLMVVAYKKKSVLRPVKKEAFDERD
jgi:hypothetical protein